MKRFESKLKCMLGLLAIKKNINGKSQNNVYIKLNSLNLFQYIGPAGCIADKSCDEIRFNVYKVICCEI